MKSYSKLALYLQLIDSLAQHYLHSKNKTLILFGITYLILPNLSVRTTAFAIINNFICNREYKLLLEIEVLSLLMGGQDPTRRKGV